jgi:integral membrane protein
MNSLRILRIVAVIEATSFLALLVASYLKHDGQGEVGVQILGPIHGLLFVAYIVPALLAREAAGWSGWTTVLVLLGAVLPFGGYVVDWKLLRPTEAEEAARA